MTNLTQLSIPVKYEKVWIGDQFLCVHEASNLCCVQYVCMGMLNVEKWAYVLLYFLLLHWLNW